MLPKIVLEEIFSLLDRKQVYELHVLCLAFYQAAFPMLLRFHSLKQVKYEYIDYQRFLKKNGRNVKGLIIKNVKDYKALLESGLSLTTVFPHMDSLSCHMLNSDTDLCEELVEDCLGLRNLKYLSLNNCLSEVPEMLFPLYGFLELLYVSFYYSKYPENWQLQSGPKRIIIDLKYLVCDLDKLNQEASKLPYEI
ncbi:hypothetical protein DSO57_1038928, partial [Entomophthora muscae]